VVAIYQVPKSRDCAFSLS